MFGAGRNKYPSIYYLRFRKKNIINQRSYHCQYSYSNEQHPKILTRISIHKEHHQEKGYRKNNKEKNKAQPERVVFFVHREWFKNKIKSMIEGYHEGREKTC